MHFGLNSVSTIAIMFSVRVPRISEDLCSPCEIGNKIMWMNPQTNLIQKNAFTGKMTNNSCNKDFTSYLLQKAVFTGNITICEVKSADY